MLEQKKYTGVKEIQQVNPVGPYKQPKQRAPTISSIDKSLTWNHNRVWSPTHQRAIKEESKVANSDWVDHKACSLLQYINVINNLFIMGNYFKELRWKNIRAYNLLQFIHHLTIEFRFRKIFMSTFIYVYENLRMIPNTTLSLLGATFVVCC